MKITRRQIRQIISEEIRIIAEGSRKTPCDQWLEYMKTTRSDEWNEKSDANPDMTHGQELEYIYSSEHGTIKTDLHDECLYTLDDMRREDRGEQKKTKKKRKTPIMDKLNKASRNLARATDLSRVSSNVSTNLERELKKWLS